MSKNQAWTSEAINLADQLVERANGDLLRWEREGGVGVDPVTRLNAQATLAGFGLLADAIQKAMVDGCGEVSLASALQDISASTQEAAKTISDAIPEETPDTSF